MENYDAYLEMRNAVVEQACSDYINSQLNLMNISKKVNPETGEITYHERYKGKRRMKDENIIKYRRRIIDCLVFFKSDWCERLSPNFNGQELIDRLNAKVKQEVENFNKYQEELLKKKREEEKLKRKRSRKKESKVS